MAKITLAKPLSGYNLAAINNNFTLIEQEFQNKALYRNNTTGEANQLETNIDANSKRILNLPAPLQNTEAARLKDVQNAIQGVATANLISYTGPNLEDTNVQALADGIGSSLVGYLPAGAGAMPTTAQGKMRERVSALDFFANGVSGARVDSTGVLDSTLGIQAGITYAVSIGAILDMPAGTYLVTDTLTCPVKTMIVGEHRSMSAINNGTKISFQPTTLKTLFSTGPTGTFKDGYCFEGLYIIGNSASAAGNSHRAFDLIKVIKSTFRNMRIDGFRTAFRVEATINNRFEFIQMANHYIECISYTGDFATTDVWEQCYIGNSPIGVQTNGANIGIRFNNCIFETIDTYGVNLVKECYAWSFTNCYGEDVPSANVATNAMFRVGFDGVTLAGNASQLSISGGYFGGRNAGAVGAFLSVDFTDGVIVGGGANITRFTNVVKTSANTQTHQIVATGWVASSISTMVSDATKVDGIYPAGVFNSATRNQQMASLIGERYTAASTACTGAITTAVSWKAEKIGSNVTLTLPSTVGVASALTNFRYGVDLPTAYRPTATLGFPCQIRDSDANQSVAGLILVSSTGSITVYRDMTAATNFTAGVNAGLGQSVGTSVSWVV